MIFTVFPSIFSLCAHVHLKNTIKSHILLAREQIMLNFGGHTGNSIVNKIAAKANKQFFSKYPQKNNFLGKHNNLSCLPFVSGFVKKYKHVTSRANDLFMNSNYPSRI